MTLPQDLIEKTLRYCDLTLEEAVETFPKSYKNLIVSISKFKLADYSDFRYLIELDISGLGLKELPKLPPTLQILNCSRNWKLRSLDKLPPTLQELKCSSNGVNEFR